MLSSSIRQLQRDPMYFFENMIDNKINNIWTCIVGEIKGYDLTARTVKVQPLIKQDFINGENKGEMITLPVLEDIPLVYIYGSNFEMTFPVEEGDECLVFFSKHCIDNWWQAGGVQNPFEIRHFDISDGFALVGVFSQKMITTTKRLQPIENGMAIRQIDDSINLEITEENLYFYTKPNTELKNELTIDKEGNNTYNIYDGNNILLENIYANDGSSTLNIYDGTNLVNSIVANKEKTSVTIKEDKLTVELTETEASLNINNKFKANATESEFSVNINDKMKITGSESEIAVNIQEKMKITGSDSSLEISANNQATVTIEGSTVSVELGASKVEISSNSIVCESGASKIEIGASGVNINGGALSIMP